PTAFLTSHCFARNQYGRIGSDVTMQCGSLDNDASVSWKVNGTDVRAQHHLEGPRLILTEVDLSHTGLYSCFQNPHGERRDTIYLHIGIPPREPTVTCRSNTYPKGFYCSWHQQHSTYIPTTFEVDVQYNQRSLEVMKDSVHKNRCHVRFPEVFSSIPYKVNVTAINALGKASTTVSFEESNIVKPDPPERVTATPIRFNPRRLEVSWHSPATWPDIDTFPLKYFLRYRPLIREQWQHVLSSGVAAKDIEIGTWSDWSVAVHATPWIEEPVPIVSTTEVDFHTETKTSPIPSSNAPQKAEPPVGRAARVITFFSPLLLGMLLLLLMW
uniref:Ciliary neurotrophic factor receptor n=1 Tax=Amphilophus citrinellus TaxID=61819 RepID=A0A3Q0QQN9_AMPCI